RLHQACLQNPQPLRVHCSGVALTSRPVRLSFEHNAQHRRRRSRGEHACVPEMRPVASSTIAAIGYDPDARELYVQFNSPPGTYVYYPVAAAVYEEFLRAPSKGDFFNRKVKGTYIYRPSTS